MRSLISRAMSVRGVDVHIQDVIERQSEAPLNLSEIRAATDFYKRKYNLDSVICGEIISPPEDIERRETIRACSLREIELISRQLKPGEKIAYFYKVNGLNPDGAHVQVLILKKDEVIIPSYYEQDFNSEDFRSIQLRCFSSPQTAGFLSTPGRNYRLQADHTSCVILGLLTLKKIMRSENYLAFEYYDKSGVKQGIFIDDLQTLHYSQSSSYIKVLKNFLFEPTGNEGVQTLKEMLVKSIEVATEKNDSETIKNNQEILSALPIMREKWVRSFESEQEKRDKLSDHRFNRALIIRRMMLLKKLFKHDPKTSQEIELNNEKDEEKYYKRILENISRDRVGWSPSLRSLENSYCWLFLNAIKSNSIENLSFLDPEEVKKPEELNQQNKDQIISLMLFIFPSNVMKREVLEKYLIRYLTQEDISKLVIAASCYYRWNLVEYLIALSEPQAPDDNALIYALNHAAHTGNQEMFDKISAVLGDKITPDLKTKAQLLLNNVKERVVVNFTDEIRRRVARREVESRNTLAFYSNREKPTNTSLEEKEIPASKTDKRGPTAGM